MNENQPVNEATPFQLQLSNLLNGVRVDEAISGLVSAILILICSTKLPTEDQEKMLAGICAAMQNKLGTARHMLTTGQLPN